MKKLLIIFLALIAAVSGFYFGYWTKTPAYAAGEIQQAVQKKDLQLFKEKVDMEKVYSSAVDDILEEFRADGNPGHKIAASLIRGLKKEVVQELIRQTEMKFKAPEDSSKSMLDKPVKSITAYIGSAALSMTDILDVEEKNGIAWANVKLHDKKLNKDFTWRVQMEKDVNGHWTAVKVTNLKEYIAERKRLLKDQIEP